MSGIAGIIHFDGKPVEPGLIERMTGAMAHRGPDGINHWVKGSVALGQCMLRTTPESLEEHQPLTNEDESLVLVMDGRVDNWEELRRELLARGAVLRNRSDAELVLRAYEIWGKECLPRIDGDFALVLWNTRRREAFCARDRMGNKPFNYHWNGTTFTFASELHTILALPWVPEIPNEGMLTEFLADEWYSRDETLWHGILRLVASYRMSVGMSGPESHRYWEPNLWETPSFRTDDEFCENYRELLADTVRRLSRSHRTVAYEVSGGLDSSAVFCIAALAHSTGRLPCPGINGYTLAFTDDDAANEIAFARAVGRHLGTGIKEMQPSVLPLAWYTEQSRLYRDFPGYPNGVMHLGLYRHAAQQGSAALLTGLGGDLWLQGSRSYYAEELVARNWAALRESFLSDARTFGTFQATAWVLRYGSVAFLPPVVRGLLRTSWMILRGSAIRGAYWLSPEMQETLEARRGKREPHQDQRVRVSGQRYLLQGLYYPFDALGRELCERLSANLGIEIRHPYLSATFAQFAFGMPERLRLRGNRSKYIHVQAMKGVVPQVVLKRVTKADFSCVTAKHLRRMRDLYTQILPELRARWLDPDGMRRLLRSYQDHPQQGWQDWVLWNIFGCDLALP